MTLPPSLRILINSIRTKPIVELYLHDNAFGPIGVEQFQDFLVEATNLKVLSVTNCGLGPEASSTIAESLLANENTKLEKLCISRSRVEDKGAIALSSYFDSYDGLTHLEISQNGVRRDGMTPLIESLRKHPSLATLNLSDNYIDAEESQAALFAFLTESEALCVLDISSSNFDKEDEDTNG